MVKFDANGQFLWHKLILGDCKHDISDVVQLSSGNFLITGRLWESNSSSKLEVVQVDQLGNTIYQNFNSNLQNALHFPQSLVRKDNSTYYLTISTFQGVKLVRVDVATGNIDTTASIILNPSLNVTTYNLIQANYGQYLLILLKNNTHSVMKLSSNGNILWEKPIATTIFSNPSYRMVEDAHNRIYLTTAKEINNQRDVHIKILNRFGDELYTKRIDIPLHSEALADITFNANDELVMLGSTNCCDTLLDILYMVDTVQTLVSTAQLNTTNEVSIFPNPTTGIINISCTNCDLPIQVNIYDTKGREIFQKIVNYSNEKININHFENGLYIYRIQDANQKIRMGKVLLQKP